MFPLGAVLFPGATLALHVFEERYRALVEHLLALPADAPRAFGVVAIRSGREVGQAFIEDGEPRERLHDVGCVAEIRDVEAYSDGRFDIVTSGTRRFRLRGLEEPGASGGPWTGGLVDWVPEPEDGPEAGQRAVPVARMLAEYVAALPPAVARELPLPGPGRELGPTALSYAVANVLVVPQGERQRLLAAPDAASRLAVEAALLRRETALVSALGAVPLHAPAAATPN
nr:LON peptidase substrate-binding domain-containing protein [Motilibacter aurantiacus]